VDAKPAARANADAEWLAAVRHALVEHDPVVRTETESAPASLPAVRPVGALLPLAPQAAPALPPATSVADAPAPHGDADHPVPPAPIPNVGSAPAH
jgi:hypothetical protein